MDNKSGNSCALVGGQFGSEGKGLIAGHIAKDYDYHVRVGAANAGHTLYTPKHAYRVAVVDGGDPSSDAPLEPTHHKHVMQQLPCAAYANPDACLIVGPGALISPEIFLVEIQKLVEFREREAIRGSIRIWVDPRAQVITREHIQREQASDLAKRIGSTSTIAKEGIGSAQAARVMREEGCVPFAAWYNSVGGDDHYLLQYVDLVDVPQNIHRKGVLLEGTQGTGLSLTTGPFPYVTSRNTTAAGLCADSGLAPTALDRVIVVCRTFPIRVAGSSGPFATGSNETDWGSLGVDPENERTTVTRLVRRVATFSLFQASEAVRINGGTEVALTFCDYLDPGIAKKTGRISLDDVRYWPEVHSLIRDIHNATGVRVTMLGTGPHHVIEVTA